MHHLLRHFHRQRQVDLDWSAELPQPVCLCWRWVIEWFLILIFRALGGCFPLHGYIGGCDVLNLQEARTLLKDFSLGRQVKGQNALARPLGTDWIQGSTRRTALLCARGRASVSYRYPRQNNTKPKRELDWKVQVATQARHDVLQAATDPFLNNPE